MSYSYILITNVRITNVLRHMCIEHPLIGKAPSYIGLNDHIPGEPDWYAHPKKGFLLIYHQDVGVYLVDRLDSRGIRDDAFIRYIIKEILKELRRR